jgi:hypothetical protein
MLKNNVYILNAPGYGGSFLRWILSKSEQASAMTTIDDPVNRTESMSHGGVGTAHLFDRKPTHCSAIRLMTWIIHNAPVDKMVYLLNVGEFLNSSLWQKISTAESYIVNFDESPIIINLHSNFEHDKAVFGFIQLTLKWPLFTSLQPEFGANRFPIDISQYNSRAGRNAYVEHWDDVFYYSNPQTVDKVVSSDLNQSLQRWIDLRNLSNPHEVNRTDGQWITPDLSRLHNIDFTDIFFNPDKLYDQLETIFKDEGDFDFSYCRKFHQTYLDNQSTLGYFDSINNFRLTGVLDPLLTSHAIYEAVVIREIFDKIPPGTNWQSMDLIDIVRLTQ